ncbi:KH domain-containing protein [Patescibacteria group bacterium]|nr:KH domain-containing protein [Patescibacteria group bacterium]MBU4512828.1 KH domain-containing protein [Patescibacteria group bacterium]MCG2693483.1 KH domain-containing protein [Candidatus Parcubacteria bacterium]
MVAKVSSDQQFVEYVIKELVDHPEDVSTDRKVDEMGVLITLKVNPEDMGQVIGRSGQNARSLRTLLRVVGAKNNARVNLKIEEPEGGRQPHQRSTDTTSRDAVDDLKL